MLRAFFSGSPAERRKEGRRISEVESLRSAFCLVIVGSTVVEETEGVCALEVHEVDFSPTGKRCLSTRRDLKSGGNYEATDIDSQLRIYRVPARCEAYFSWNLG